jgi:hypothetical protein
VTPENISGTSSPREREDDPPNLIPHAFGLYDMNMEKYLVGVKGPENT